MMPPLRPDQLALVLRSAIGIDTSTVAELTGLSLDNVESLRVQRPFAGEQAGASDFDVIEPSHPLVMHAVVSGQVRAAIERTRTEQEARDGADDGLPVAELVQVAFADWQPLPDLSRLALGRQEIIRASFRKATALRDSFVQELLAASERLPRKTDAPGPIVQPMGPDPATSRDAAPGEPSSRHARTSLGDLGRTLMVLANDLAEAAAQVREADFGWPESLSSKPFISLAASLERIARYLGENELRHLRDTLAKVELAYQPMDVDGVLGPLESIAAALLPGSKPLVLPERPGPLRPFPTGQRGAAVEIHREPNRTSIKVKGVDDGPCSREGLRIGGLTLFVDGLDPWTILGCDVELDRTGEPSPDAIDVLREWFGEEVLAAVSGSGTQSPVDVAGTTIRPAASEAGHAAALINRFAGGGSPMLAAEALVHLHRANVDANQRLDVVHAASDALDRLRRLIDVWDIDLGRDKVTLRTLHDASSALAALGLFEPFPIDKMPDGDIQQALDDAMVASWRTDTEGLAEKADSGSTTDMLSWRGGGEQAPRPEHEPDLPTVYVGTLPAGAVASASVERRALSVIVRVEAGPQPTTGLFARIRPTGPEDVPVAWRPFESDGGGRLRATFAAGEVEGRAIEVIKSMETTSLSDEDLALGEAGYFGRMAKIHEQRAAALLESALNAAEADAETELARARQAWQRAAGYWRVYDGHERRAARCDIYAERATNIVAFAEARIEPPLADRLWAAANADAVTNLVTVGRDDEAFSIDIGAVVQALTALDSLLLLGRHAEAAELSGALSVSLARLQALLRKHLGQA